MVRATGRGTMSCPRCGNPVLADADRAYAFCRACLRKYKLCSSVEYMKKCELEDGHTGMHMASERFTWSDL